jgi:hypothetical protein
MKIVEQVVVCAFDVTTLTSFCNATMAQIESPRRGHA